MSRALLSACLLITLAGCGGGESKTEALDRQLVAGARGAGNGQADPAMTGALADQIMIDPNLTATSGAHAARQPEGPRQTPLPPELPGATGARGEREALLHAPAPVTAAQAAARGETLGELAKLQAAPKTRAPACDHTLRYSAAWATRLPPAIPLYPDAAVREAAGNDSPGCKVRIASFASAAPIDRLVDWYYSHAVRAGYSAEHQVDGGDHIVGGTSRDGQGAYYVLITARAGGGSEVDIVANHGR